MKKSFWPKPLEGKDSFLPERLEEEQEVVVNIIYNGKTHPTPAKLHQREDGTWMLKTIEPIKVTFQ